MRTPGGLKALLLVSLTAIYAVCFVVIKAGLDYAPPLQFGGLRALIGGAALLGLMVVLRQPLLPPRRHWVGVLVLALTATTLSFGAMFLSPGRAGAGIASVLGNTQPLILVVLAAAFLGERMTRGKWISLILGLTGVSLISWQALAGPNVFGLSGTILALTAAAGAAFGSIFFKHMRVTTGLLAIAAWQLILGSLPLLAVSALLERDPRVIWNVQFVAPLLFLALVGTAFANAGWYWLVQRGDVGRLALYLFFVPIFGLGIAAQVFGERVGPLEIAGSLLTIAAIGIAAWAGERRLPTVRTAG